MKKIFFPLFLIFLFSCGLTGKRNFRESDKNIIDIEILESNFSFDTLHVIAVGEWINYPFGKYETPFGPVTYLPPGETRLFRINTNEDYPPLFGCIYKVNRSQLKFIQSQYAHFTDDDYDNTVHITMAEISDSSIVMKGEIRIGISKDDFFRTLLPHLNSNRETIRVVTLENGLLGTWHYYIFKGEKLDKIAIKTDSFTDHEYFKK